MIAYMDDAGFIVASYAATFGGVAVFVVWMVRKGRALARRLPNEDKPWT